MWPKGGGNETELILNQFDKIAATPPSVWLATSDVCHIEPAVFPFKIWGQGFWGHFG